MGRRYFVPLKLATQALIVPSLVEGMAPVATPTPAESASTAAKARTACIQKRFTVGSFQGIWRAHPGSCIQRGTHRPVAGEPAFGTPKVRSLKLLDLFV